MDEKTKSAIGRLEAKLRAVPELLKERAKTISEQLAELEQGITELEELRAKLAGKDTIDEFNRMKVELHKDRLKREPELIKRQAKERLPRPPIGRAKDRHASRD